MEKLWTKDYVLNILDSLLLFVVFYLLMVYTTKLAIMEFSVSVSEAGLASGIYIVGALVARLFISRYMDFIGRKRMLIIASIIHAICTFGYHFIDGMLFLCTLRFVQGITYGMASTVIATTVASIVPESRRGEGIGYFTLSITLGSAIGPFLGITLPQINPLYALALCDILSISIIVLAFILNITEIKVGFRQRVEVKSFRLRTFFEPTAIPISVVALLGAIGYSAVMSYIGTYSEAVGLLLGGSLFYVAYSIACLIFRPISGVMIDRYGNHVVMVPILFTMILGFIAIAVAQSNLMLLLGAVLVGIGYGSIPSAGQTIAVQKVKLNKFSLATSTLYIALDLGNGIGPYILGMVVPVYGFRAVYMCSAVAALFAFLFYIGMIIKAKRVNKVDVAI
ncbi:MFS transporter [uncultured Megamonas sp.]|uniref:MFS transporter n=1 Tax=uncultured Megamonas sp. TaxID=286140 RepID=UPI0025FD6F28|nr:MFS transporter [uncultured Megamonas sp.]